MLLPSSHCRHAQITCVMLLLLSCNSDRNDQKNTEQQTKPTAKHLEAVGVQECDEYVRQVQRCISNAPHEQKPTLTNNLLRTHATWSSLASNPGTRSSLGATCGAALRTAKGAMQELHCDW